jgi:hypothetical protein
MLDLHLSQGTVQVVYNDKSSDAAESRGYVQNAYEEDRDYLAGGVFGLSSLIS